MTPPPTSPDSVEAHHGASPATVTTAAREHTDLQGLRVLALVTDAYGGYGGIAQYNRDLLDALGASAEVKEIVALPRVVPRPLEPVPPRVRYDTRSAGSLLRYASRAALAAAERPDVILCAHVNLLPLAAALKSLSGARLVLGVYGIDVWTPLTRRGTARALQAVDAVYSISEVTRERFEAWAPIGHAETYLLPNAIHLDQYGPGEKCEALLDRYGLHGKRVLMTTGRLAGKERYKGFDVVMDALARLLPEHPDLVYVIVGTGDDRPRLEAHAVALGVAERVVFTGFVDEAEKADHFRLADAYVMPSEGEGFGFVFLEALACGIPAVGSTTDGGREALRHGQLGRLVNPAAPVEIDAAILAALATPKGIPAGLDHFAFPHFTRRAEAMICSVAR